jgi:hypothetical protein
MPTFTTEIINEISKALESVECAGDITVNSIKDSMAYTVDGTHIQLADSLGNRYLVKVIALPEKPATSPDQTYFSVKMTYKETSLPNFNGLSKHSIKTKIINGLHGTIEQWENRLKDRAGVWNKQWKYPKCIYEFISVEGVE